MKDRVFIRDYLMQYFDEIEPKDFYRAIFPEGELERQGEQIQGKYNAIAVELLPKADKERGNARRFIMTDGFEILDRLLESNNFIIMSPISYIGRSRQAQNARNIYAMAIDLDGITEQHYLVDLFHQFESEYLPKPTYIVWSGTGLHLYYKFKQPLPCFKNIVKQLSELKTALTKRIWNSFVSELYEKPQIESLFQGFRIVGGITKGGNRTKAFDIGEEIDIDYLNDFVPKECKVTEFAYKSSLTKKEAAAKYPEWYKKRIEEHKPRGTWVANKAVYDWWLNKLHEEIGEGHRYYGIMVLAIYAKKCGVPEDILENDAFGLLEEMEKLTVSEENHFTREDILAALELYNDNYITFPIDTITQLTAIPIQKNKRNGRKQEVHLARARAVQNIDYPNGEWRYHGGRPKGSKNRDIILNWKEKNPYKTAKECIAETKIGKSTVYKYWNEGIDKDE